MSPERDDIIVRLWKRMAGVQGVQTTARNPVNPPKDGDMPRINIFEMDDQVKERSMRGGSAYPSYKRDFTVLVEAFVKGTSEQSATKELGAFVKELKKKLYEGGITLGLKGVEVAEVATGELLRPAGLDLVVGVGIVLSIRYVEDVSKIMS